MTGVGGRPELIIEGSNDLDGPWLVHYLQCSVSPSFLLPLFMPALLSQSLYSVSFDDCFFCSSFVQEYDFHYKPGNLSEPPPIVGKSFLLVV